MATAVIVKNNGRKDVNLTGAILSHFKFKKRGGTAIQGLRGCSYCTHPPLSSPFELLSPSEAMKSEDPGWFSFGWEPKKKLGVWAVQDVPITFCSTSSVECTLHLQLKDQSDFIILLLRNMRPLIRAVSCASG